MEQISENAERISIIYENCKFSKIGSKTFVRSQKFENLKELKFYNSEFNEIQRKAFDFYARDVMLEIEGSKEPFELNQDIFVDNQVTKFILKNVKLQELTKEALQGEYKTQWLHSFALSFVFIGTFHPWMTSTDEKVSHLFRCPA